MRFRVLVLNGDVCLQLLYVAPSNSRFARSQVVHLVSRYHVSLNRGQGIKIKTRSRRRDVRNTTSGLR